MARSVWDGRRSRSIASPVLHLVVNPRAGVLRSQPQLIARLRMVTHRFGQVWVTETQADLERAADAIAVASPASVALCGGDGTFMRGLSALVPRFEATVLPPLGLLPAGTVGSIARNWRLGVDVVQAAARLGRLGEGFPTTVRPSLRVREHSGTERHGFTFGAGLVPRFFARYDRERSRGRWTAARIFARVFAGSLLRDEYSRGLLDPVPCRLVVDGMLQTPRAFSLILSSVLTDVGLGMRITHRAEETPGRLQLVASDLLAHGLGSRALSVWLGSRERASARLFCVDQLVERFSVEFVECSSLAEPSSYVLDGDGFCSPGVAIAAGPPLRVIDWGRMLGQTEPVG